MLSAANRRLARAPVAKPRAAPAQNTPCIQSTDLSAPAAMAADWRAVGSLNGHCDTVDVERKSA
jgi:hypothetical protein